jgi:hypothetical protein
MDLAPGPWTVVGWGRGGSRVREDVELAPGATSEIDLRLAAAASLLVSVVGTDGLPREGALVAPRTAPGEPPVYDRPRRTGRDGRVRLDDLPLGPLTLTARTLQGEVGTLEADVGSSPDEELVLRVSPRRPR